MVFDAADSVTVSVAAGVPALAGRDAAFAGLAREAVQDSGERSAPLTGGESLTSWLADLTPLADRSLPTVRASGGEKPVSSASPFAPESGPAGGFDSGAVGVTNDPFTGEERRRTPGLATDSVFAALIDDALTDG
jgi:hypothetical protein